MTLRKLLRYGCPGSPSLLISRCHVSFFFVGFNDDQNSLRQPNRAPCVSEQVLMFISWDVHQRGGALIHGTGTGDTGLWKGEISTKAFDLSVVPR